jgi:hypothetical protein
VTDERRAPSVSAPVSHPGPAPASRERPSALIDTRVVYCGDCLDQLGKRAWVGEFFAKHGIKAGRHDGY